MGDKNKKKKASKDKHAERKLKSKAKAPEKKKRKLKMADKVDKYDLYIRSVQDFEHEVKFFNRIYKENFRKEPVILREDFCGTFGVCCEWVKCGDDRIAIGIDLDPEPLQWGKTHLASVLEQEQRRRITIHKTDVRDIHDEKADVLAAQNFSFWLFKTRKELLNYFECMYANIADKGIAVMDMFGGYESMAEQVDKRDIDVPSILAKEFKKTQPAEFEYQWDQAGVDAITMDATFHIHFKFKDGSKLENAFTYEWRFWHIPEVRELLLEAGFSRVDVFWDVADSDDEESKYEKRDDAENEPAWICYLVAVK